MTQPASIPFSNRLAAFFEGVVRLLFVRQGTELLTAAFSLFATGWFRRKQRWLESRLEQLRDGTLTPPRKRDGDAGDEKKPQTRKRTQRAPKDFAWLQRLLPNVQLLAIHAVELRQLLASEEIAGLVKAAPRAIGIIRALCLSLGVELPDGGVPPEIWPKTPYRRRQLPCPPPVQGRIVHAAHPSDLKAYVQNTRVLTVFLRLPLV